MNIGNILYLMNNDAGREKHHHLTIKKKLEIIAFAENNSNHKASQVYDVDRKSIRDWRTKKFELVQSSHKSTKKTLHKGKVTEIMKFDNELLSFISFQRNLDLPVTTSTLIVKLVDLAHDKKSCTFNALQKWVYRFMKRSNLSFRRGTHIGQSLPDKHNQLVMNFLKYNISELKQYNFELDCICNMDETPVYLNMPPNYTIEKIGSRQVSIKTLGQEKTRVSLVLAILADGNKLPPLLIFKAKPNKTVENKLRQNKFVFDGSTRTCME